LRTKIREVKLENLRGFALFMRAALTSRACEECARITLVKRRNLLLPFLHCIFLFFLLSRYIFTFKHRENIYLFQKNLRIQCYLILY